MKKKIIAGIAVATIAVGGFGGAYVYNKQAEAKEIAEVEAKESNHFKEAIAAVRQLNKNLNEKNLLAAKSKTELVSDKTAKKSLLADIKEAEKKIHFSKELGYVTDKKGVIKSGVTKKQISSLKKELAAINDKKFVKKESKLLKGLSEQQKVLEKSNKALKAGMKSRKDIDLAEKEISKIKNPVLKEEMKKKLAKLEKSYEKSKTKVVKKNIVTSNEKSNQGVTDKTSSSNKKVNNNNNNNYSVSSGGNNQNSNNQKSYNQKPKSNNTSGYKGNNSNNSGSSAKPKSYAQPKPKPKNNGGTSTTGERTGGGKIKNSDSTYETGVADGNDLSGVPWDSFSK